MIRAVPDYYPEFHCIASRCGHSCCIGWEVDVSADALERYRQVEGPFGDRLRRSITGEDCPHFVLEAGERCPFLNGENLCDIILTLGEKALCQICADHPRWRNWFADRVEEGLGLCCEEAARLLLSHEGPVRWLEEPIEEADEEPGEEYLALLESRSALTALLQDRSKPLQIRLCEACSLCGIEEEMGPFGADLELLLGLEILEPRWESDLRALWERPEPVWNPAWDRDGEQLLVYLLNRYYLAWGLERWAEDFALRFGRFSLRLLGALYDLQRTRTGALTLPDQVEQVRRWSAELEYSEENLEALAGYLL